MDIHSTEKRSRELKERSSSARHIKSGRDHLNYDYFGRTTNQDPPQLISKQSYQLPSKEYNLSDHKTQSKNLNDNNDYIKTLYKKYLGKQNNNKSQRKQRAEGGVVKNLFGNEGKKIESTCKPLKENVTIINSIKTQQSHKKTSFEEDNEPLTYCNTRYTLSKKQSGSTWAELPKKKDKGEQTMGNFYKTMMNQDYLSLMGNSRSSLILCMKEICRAKKIAAASRSQ